MAISNPADSRSITGVTPADWLTQKPQGSWTYEDYAALAEDGNRYEIIDGVIYMAASPNTNHQSASTWIHHYLVVFVLVAQKGRVFHAPYDVTLPSGTTTQPDVIVVLNSNLIIIQPEKINGSPDLVVEVSSPSTRYYDRNRKKSTYERNGIKEYWIVDSETQEVEVFELQSGVYVSLGTFKGKSLLPTKIIPGFPVRVEQFFV